jgi:hypothetical protein
MGLAAVGRRIERWAGRFNRWFSGAAVAAGAERSGSAGGPPTIDPTSVVAGIGEIERQGDAGDEAASEESE